MRQHTKIIIGFIVAVQLLLGSFVFAVLYRHDDFMPFFAAAHLVRRWQPLVLEQTPKHAPPDLQNFPTALDDLVIVAHYDDETIGAAGLIKSELDAGHSVGVVVVTFSEGDWAAQRNWYGLRRRYKRIQWRYIFGVPLSPADRSDYAITREGETDHALNLLGVPKANRLYLRYPNEGVEPMLADPEKWTQGNYADPLSGGVERYQGNELTDVLRQIISRVHPQRVITHYVDDTNADHRAIGRLVERLVTKEQLAPLVWSFLVHWNTKSGGWVPEQYQGEYAWLKVDPKEYYQAPAGSPTDGVTETQLMHMPWSGNFSVWKRELLRLYRTQLKYSPEFPAMYAKKNELYWNLPAGQLFDLRYGE